VLWGRHGVVEAQFDALALWEKAVPGVTGRAVDAGHYLPEEAPGEVLAEILDFFSGGTSQQA
jgi:haloacetate dehalogenase